MRFKLFKKAHNTPTTPTKYRKKRLLSHTLTQHRIGSFVTCGLIPHSTGIYSKAYTTSISVT
jgi:hypothetical protein